MKLTAAISAIKAATSRLGIAATSSASHIKLLAEVGYFLIHINKLDGVDVSDKSSALEEALKAFFKPLSNNAALADDVASDFYKNLSEHPAFADSQILDFFKGLVDVAAVAEAHHYDYTKYLVDDVAGSEDHVLILTKKVKDDFASLSDVNRFDLERYLLDTSAAFDHESRDFFKSAADHASFGDGTTAAFEKYLADTVGITDDIDGAASILDDQEMQFFKTTTDRSTITDTFYRMVAYVRYFDDGAAFVDVQHASVGKTLDDASGFTDAQTLSFGKLAGDVSSAQEFSVRAYGVSKTDSANTADAHSAAFAKPLSDGLTSHEQISKGVSLAPFVDSSTVTDNDTLSAGLVKTESTLFSDSGSLRSQGYCDFTYFAEDFVGASRTF